jgi:hypothetical protein
MTDVDGLILVYRMLLSLPSYYVPTDLVIQIIIHPLGALYAVSLLYNCLG